MNTRPLLALLTVCGLGAAPALAGPIEDAVRNHPDGTIRFQFEAKEGIYGDGRSIIFRDQGEGYWDDCDCEEGPVRVLLEVDDGEVLDLEARVGGRWRPGRGDVDLGEVTPALATAFLLDLVRTGDAHVAEEAIFPATIGRDVEVWSELLLIARDRHRPERVREQAVFWVGQAAAEEATRGLEEIIEDEGELELKKSVVFALSQRPEDQAVASLMRVARTHESAELRKSALFWLGQVDDPRVLALFEEILLAR